MLTPRWVASGKLHSFTIEGKAWEIQVEQLGDQPRYRVRASDNNATYFLTDNNEVKDLLPAEVFEKMEKVLDSHLTQQDRNASLSLLAAYTKMPSSITYYDPEKDIPEPPKGKEWIMPGGKKAPPIRKDKIWGDVKPTGICVYDQEFWKGQYFIQFSKPDVAPPRCRVIGVFDGYAPNLTVEYNGDQFIYNDQERKNFLPYPEEVHRVAKLAYEGLAKGYEAAQKQAQAPQHSEAVQGWQDRVQEQEKKPAQGQAK